MQGSIEYIKTLGVDSIWLSPFYQNGHDNCSSHHTTKPCDPEHQNYDWTDITNHVAVGDWFGNGNDLDDLLTELEMNGEL